MGNDAHGPTAAWEAPQSHRCRHKSHDRAVREERRMAREQKLNAVCASGCASGVNAGPSVLWVSTPGTHAALHSAGQVREEHTRQLVSEIDDSPEHRDGYTTDIFEEARRVVKLSPEDISVMFFDGLGTPAEAGVPLVWMEKVSPVPLLGSSDVFATDVQISRISART